MAESNGIRDESCSTLYRVVLNETPVNSARYNQALSCSTLYRVVLNETALSRIKVEMIFDLQAEKSLFCAI